MRMIIDLSLPLFEGMAYYPTDPPTVLREAKSIAHDRTKVTEVRFGSHTGTHVDVPSHVFQGGKSLEQMDLACFLGSAVKLHLDRFMEYDLAELQYDGILLETGWGQWYGEPSKYHGDSRPSIPLYLVDKLLERDLKFFGCDLPGVDKRGAMEKIVHSRFFARDVVIYENLANLENLPDAVPFTFVGLPLNFQGIDGSPVRAIAILEGGGF